MKLEIEDRYLGDGVYASFDGYHVVLDLRAQDSTTRIALEPPVMRSLIHYFEFIMESARDQSDPKDGAK